MTQPYKHIDTTQINAISGNDREFKIELIDIFLEQIPQFVSIMNAALQEKDWVLLAREAHTAKSSALTFGMDEAGVSLKEIQLYAERHDFDKLPDLVTSATNQLNSAIPELHNLKSSL